MGKATKKSITAAFKAETKEITIEAWGGSTVTIKKLSIAERNAVEEIMFQDQSLENVRGGEIAISMGKIGESALLTVSYALVSPRFKVSELGDLSADGMAGITEIKAALDEWDTPKKSEEEKDSSK